MFLFTIRYIRYPIHLENQCKKYKALALNERSNLRRRVAPPTPRLRGDQPAGPGAPAGVLLAGGADDRPDVEVSGPPRETHLLPGPQPEQVPPPDTFLPSASTFKTTTVTHGLIV